LYIGNVWKQRDAMCNGVVHIYTWLNGICNIVLCGSFPIFCQDSMVMDRAHTLMDFTLVGVVTLTWFFGICLISIYVVLMPNGSSRLCIVILVKMENQMLGRWES